MARALQKTQAYYNEKDSKAAAWFREPIKRDLIAPGIRQLVEKIKGLEPCLQL